MAKIIVTGGAGFIGSHIVEDLISLGHAVEVIDNLSSGNKDNLPQSIRIHKLDIRSLEARTLLKEYKPDIVVHAAAQMSVRLSMEDPAFDTHVNVYGLVNLLQAFIGDEQPFFILLSTGGAIYGEQDSFPASENHKLEPTSVYGLAKRVSELYLDLWKTQFGMQSVSLRLGNVYGPRQSPHGEAGVVAIFYERLYRGKVPTINGTGLQTRDFVFVRDVSKAVGYVAEKRITGTFNIGTGKETSVNELYKLICKTSGLELEALYGSAKSGEQMRSCIDPSLALKTFDWKPTHSLNEGLQITADWFRKAN